MTTQNVPAACCVACYKLAALNICERICFISLNLFDSFIRVQDMSTVWIPERLSFYIELNPISREDCIKI